MSRPVYIAELSETDYPRFRSKDPTLPATYKEWLAAIAERVRIMRRQGENPIRRPIDFDAFTERNETICVDAFDEATRDDYADEQAMAEIAGRRL